MFVKLENPVVLSKAVDIISELVTEVRIKINEFGLTITAIDPANVAMIGYKLPRSAFSEFESGEEILGVNLDDLKRILKRCGTKSSITIKKNENRLELEIMDKLIRKFTLNLIEVEGEDKEMPSLEFSSKIEVASTDLITSIEDCAIVSESCLFEVLDGKFIIQSKGLNSARTEFSGDEAKIEAENCKSRYSLEYLSKFVKGSKLAENTTLHFATDHPLKFAIRTEHMELDFILAPRVETED